MSTENTDTHPHTQKEIATSIRCASCRPLWRRVRKVNYILLVGLQAELSTAEIEGP